MNEPWLSSEICKFLPMLVVGLPIFVLGVVGGSLSEEYFKQYFPAMLGVAFAASVGAIIFGLAAKLFEQPSFVSFGFLLAGAIGVIIVIGLWYVTQQA